MNKIKTAFENKKALISFLTAGDPNFDASYDNIMAMVDAGADLIEIGIPFSDPIAEGAVVQEANIRALGAGMTTDRAFELAAKVRASTDVPLCFVTYLNPVFKYGYDRFFERCARSGIDGIICPDLPYEEKREASEYAKKHGVALISIVVPAEEARLKMIAQDAEGFIYMLPPADEAEHDEILSQLKNAMSIVKKYTDIPVAVNFGASTPEQAKEIADFADGVIPDNAGVYLIEKHGENAAPKIAEYVKSMKDAIR